MLYFLFKLLDVIGQLSCTKLLPISDWLSVVTLPEVSAHCAEMLNAGCTNSPAS